MTTTKLSLTVSAAALALGLAGCGGGGGGGEPSALPPPTGGSPAPTVPANPPPLTGGTAPTPAPVAPPPAPPSPTPSWDTTQYRNSAAADINAGAFYDEGAFGQGVTIGVIDSGVADPSNALDGRITYGISGTEGLDTDNASHGSRIASIAAARQGGAAGMHGVAPQANVFAYTAGARTSGNINTGGAARGIDAAVAQGVDAIGLSFGGDRVAGEAIDISGSLQFSIAEAARQGVVFVVAAGNDSRDNVASLAAFPLYFTAAFEGNTLISNDTNPLNGRYIAVAALDRSGNELANFSNACGMAKNFCLSTVGASIQSLDKTGATSTGQGTSYAQPVVLGAFAVLKSMWPTLPETDIVEILLRSADDIGEAGVDEVFGYGRLNLANAVNPQGGLNLPVPDYSLNLDTGGAPVTSSVMVASSAMGSSLRKMAAGAPSLAVFDAYGRGYSIDMAAFATEARKRLDFHDEVSRMAQMRDLVIETYPGVTMRFNADTGGRYDPSRGATAVKVDGMTVAFAREGRATDIPGVASFRGASRETRGYIDASRLENPYLALLGSIDAFGGMRDVGDARFGAFVATGETEGARDAQAFGVAAGYGFDGGDVSVTVGRVSEDSGMLGAYGAGAFGFGDSDTTFGSISGRADMGDGWALTGDAHVGMTEMGSGGGLINDGAATSTAWNVGIQKTGVLSDRDTASASFGQSLTVESGSIGLSVPTAQGFARHEGSLEDGREMNARLGWTSDLNDNGRLTLGGILRLNADGVQGETDFGAAVAYERRF